MTSAAPPTLRHLIGRCDTCPIRNRAVCSYSNPEQLAELDRIKFYRDFPPGAEIVGEGEPVTALGSIVSGVVALQRTLEDGRRQMVGLLLPSDFIGRPLRDEAPYSAVAVEAVRMCLFDKRRFEDLLKSNASLERRLLEMMLDELDGARDWMVLLGRKTAREKLASFLLMLARRTAAGRMGPPGLSMRLPLSREAISEFIGLTIETVSRQFTQLRKDGVIELPDTRSVRILDHAALVRASGETDPDSSDRERA